MVFERLRIPKKNQKIRGINISVSMLDAGFIGLVIILLLIINKPLFFNRAQLLYIIHITGRCHFV